jgi:hypothetical protein
MGTQIMKIHHEIRQQLIQKVQEEFNQAYPFLKIEFRKTGRENAVPVDSTNLGTTEQIRDSAKALLEKEIGLSDQLKVSGLETALGHLFGTTAQVYRRSGNFWLGTNMSREWTLRQQNDHASDIADEFQ